MSLWWDHPSKRPERLRNLPGRESNREVYGLWTDTTEQAPALERFPPDFMFQLTKEEVSIDRSHFVTASCRNVSAPHQRKNNYICSAWPSTQGSRNLHINLN